jgi:hypothetical protein
MEVVAPSDTIVLSFFFYASGTELQNSILGFFRSLLFQLLDQDEDSRSAFMKICRQHYKSGRRVNSQFKWHPVELEVHFQKFVIGCSARRNIFIFVDALDECEDRDRDRLISFLHNLRCSVQSKKNRPWIITSCRPYPDGQIKADFQIRLEKENQNDVQSFVEHCGCPMKQPQTQKTCSVLY